MLITKTRLVVPIITGCALLWGQLATAFSDEEIIQGDTSLSGKVKEIRSLMGNKVVGKDTEAPYEPSFPSLSRSIIGRQDGSSNTPLQNNIPAKAQIAPNTVLSYVFPSTALRGSPATPTAIVPPQRKQEAEVDGSSQLELKRRQNDDVQYHLTLSVCSQPSPSGGTASAPLPPLLLFFSYTNSQPLSGTDRPQQIEVNDGFATFTDHTSDNVFIQVQAIEVPPGYNGSYSFELTCSIDLPYAVVETTSSLNYVDSDSAGAMLTSTDLTDPSSGDGSEADEWRKLGGAPFTVAVVNQNYTQMTGLMKSYCAFQNNTQVAGNFAGQNKSNVDIGYTTIGDGALKQQFYVSGLNGSSSYSAVMGLPTNFSTAGPGQPGGGGTIWQAINFTTQTGMISFGVSVRGSLTSLDGNCRVIYNLSFCDQVNYAVPYNPTNQQYQGINLTDWYDGQAQNWWANFSKALDQVACDTTPDAQYSLAVNCKDCQNSYKEWLCAVTIPRCRDFSSQASYLLPRAVNSSFYNPSTVPARVSLDPFLNSTNQQVLAYAQSRNPAIDQVINPGPYKELLPCGSMCYDLVRTCPAALGFACPSDVKGFNMSYGYPQMDGAFPQCNIPGQTTVSAGTLLSPPSLAMILAGMVVSLVIHLGTG
ncbi:stretch-activated cation channel mid1 [Thelotrema lepadinum]|nr:stretch-activated cation channel mid1 [Thelotrema lepadinum]